MKPNKIWIVEMWVETWRGRGIRSRWEPTVGAALNRDDGRHELRVWRNKNPDDRFRLVPYSAALRAMGASND